MNNKSTTFTTTKEFKTIFKGYDITIPIGSKATNQTACGVDDNYRFLDDFGEIAKSITGFNNSILYHDLVHYGLNIPKEYF